MRHVVTLFVAIGGHVSGGRSAGCPCAARKHRRVLLDVTDRERPNG